MREEKKHTKTHKTRNFLSFFERERRKVETSEKIRKTLEILLFIFYHSLHALVVSRPVFLFLCRHYVADDVNTAKRRDGKLLPVVLP